MAGKAYRYMHNANTLGHAASYRLDPPKSVTRWDAETDDDVTREYSLVVVSALDNYFAHETLVFPSDEYGDISDWTEIYGIRDTTDHEEVLRAMGYEIEYDPSTIVQVEDDQTIAGS